MELYRVTYTDKAGFVTNVWRLSQYAAVSLKSELWAKGFVDVKWEVVEVPTTALSLQTWLNENSNTPPGSQQYVSVPDTHPHAEALKQPLSWPEMGEPVVDLEQPQFEANWPHAAIGTCEPVVNEPTLGTHEPTLGMCEPALAAQGSKPTNPKDAIGIRKAPLSVVPMDVIVEVGVGMLEGTAKYGRHNYRCAGVRASVYFDATMRHLISWWEGEDIDPDSGLSHITKAICSLVVWRAAQLQQRHTDDRPPKATPFYEQANAKAAAILDKHADKNPRHYTIEDTGLTV